jgi:RND family efflux transporter MFP subunit
MTAAAQDMIEVSNANRVAIGVETETLTAASNVDLITATGMVTAPINQMQTLSSPFEGVLIEPLIVAGMDIKKGQNIAFIYSADYAALKVDRAQAALMAEHNAGLAKRAIELADIGLRSVEEVDEAEHEAQSSLIALRALDKRLNRVRPAAESGEFYILAGKDGTVTHVNAAAGDSLAMSEPLATIFSGETYWASVPVPEANIDLVEIGTDVSVQNTNMTGTVIAIDPEVNGVSRTLNVTVELPGDYRWRLGGLVTATFLTPSPTNSVPVPTRAIVRMSGQTYVFRETDGGFTTVPVIVISQSSHTSFVSGRLSAGDHVAVSGLAALKNVAEGG